LLVAVVLSAQATDKGVNRATRPLFRAHPTPQAMVALGEEGIADYIQTIGLYRTKAKNVARLSQLLLERHGGEVPDQREALEALPGVGRKTANVVLNIAFGQPTIAVDTHIFRVGNRTGLAPGKDVDAVEQQAAQGRPRRVPPARPPLADPAWPLPLQGAHAGLPALSGDRLVRFQGQDPCLTRPATRRGSSSSMPGPNDASACRRRRWKRSPQT
jgi:endonuclease III